MKEMSKAEIRLRNNLKKYPRMVDFGEETILWLESDENMDAISDYIEKEHPDFIAVMKKAMSIYD